MWVQKPRHQSLWCCSPSDTLWPWWILSVAHCVAHCLSPAGCHTSILSFVSSWLITAPPPSLSVYLSVDADFEMMSIHLPLPSLYTGEKFVILQNSFWGNDYSSLLLMFSSWWLPSGLIQSNSLQQLLSVLSCTIIHWLILLSSPLPFDSN